MEYNSSEWLNGSGFRVAPGAGAGAGVGDQYGGYDYAAADFPDPEYVHPFHVPRIKAVFICLYSVVFACCFFGEFRNFR